MCTGSWHTRMFGAQQGDLGRLPSLVKGARPGARAACRGRSAHWHGEAGLGSGPRAWMPLRRPGATVGRAPPVQFSQIPRNSPQSRPPCWRRGPGPARRGPGRRGPGPPPAISRRHRPDVAGGRHLGGRPFCYITRPQPGASRCGLEAASSLARTMVRVVLLGTRVSVAKLL